MRYRIIFNVIASIMVISNANAYDTAQKEKCLQNSDKVVWVESTGACVPLNTCNDSRYSAYCDNTTFSQHVDAINSVAASELAELHAEVINGFELPAVNTYLHGTNYVGITDYNNKNYIVYDFGSVTNDRANPLSIDILRLACRALDGSIDDEFIKNDLENSYILCKFYSDAKMRNCIEKIPYVSADLDGNTLKSKEFDKNICAIYF